ncbi:MAG: hypothetical protein PUH91_13780 [Prevotella sp.]|nr:hypothetical protein [Prevotella sp.]
MEVGEKMIPKEMCEKYNVADASEYATESEFYMAFLSVTDHIPSKILEGVATSADYADELYYREVARQQINGGEITQAVPLDVLLSTLLGVE